MVTNSKRSAVAQFCDSERYKNSSLVYKDEDDYGEYMHVQDPVVLAAFVAFCSDDHRPVFLRGCCRGDFPHSYPSLYRDGPDGKDYCKDPDKRWRAYKSLLKKLEELKQQGVLTGTRWDRPNLGAILQHYGVKTPWLDVVRNLYTAIWFATHELVDVKKDPLRRKVKPTREDDGWILLFAACRPGQQRLTVGDLMETQSSLHVRPHAQHGLSLGMKCDPTERDEGFPPTARTTDFNTHRITRVRFPARSEKWKLCGHMFRSSFLFPGRQHDDSLQQLMSDEVRSAIKDACSECNIDKNALGTVYTVDIDR